MEEKSLRHNYFFILIKFVLFWIILCFCFGITSKSLFYLKKISILNFNIFLGSVISTLIFYIFLADLNNFYKKVQSFFFHNTFIGYLFSSFLIILFIFYLIIPKLFNFNLDKEIFIFLAVFFFIMQLIYISKEIRGKTFSDFINYLFLFSIFYLVNFLFLNLYFYIFLKINFSEIFIEGIREGVNLLSNFFIEIFPTVFKR